MYFGKEWIILIVTKIVYFIYIFAIPAIRNNSPWLA